MASAIKKIAASISLTLIIFFVGCGSGITGAAAPVMNQVVPQTIQAGSKSQMLKVTGSNFSNTVVLLWNGAPLATTVVDPQTLTATISSSDLSTPSTAQLKVQDPQTMAESQALPVVIAPAVSGTTSPLALTTTSLPQSVAGSPYVATLDATGGTPAYTWSLASGQLPIGLTLSTTTGIISGTPTTSGTYSFAVALVDSSTPSQTASATVTLSVAPAQTAPIAPLTITTTSLPNGTTGTAYSTLLQATGGTAPYFWSITSGNLPSGLNLAANTGVISGTPIASGSFPIAVTVKDSVSMQTVTANLAFSIVFAGAPLSIASATLPSAMLNQSYSATLTAAGGTAPYSWSITSGALPAGLNLATSGAVLGSPTAVGTFNFIASVADSSNPTQTKSASISLVVSPATLSIVAPALPSGTDGAGYSNALQATGGTAPYTWSMTSGSLPSGLNLGATTGVVSGTPTASGTFNFTASVSDASSPAQSKSAQISLVIAPTTLSITSATLPSGANGSGYSNALQAAGGTAPYTWSVTSGSLPSGLSLGATTGVVSGTPTASGTFNFTITVNDAGTPSQTRSAQVALVIAPATLTIATAALPAGTQGSSYSGTIHINGGNAPFAWSITGGSLPAGLTLGATTGVVTGTPTASGSFTVSVTVKDSASSAQTATAMLPLNVVAAGSPLAITSSTLHSGTTNTLYNATLNATGGAAPYTWSVNSGSLPAGFSLAAATGLLSCTPIASGTITFTATVSDSSSPAQTTSAPISFIVAPPALSIITSSLPSGTQGTNYSSGLQATGGTTPYTWSITSGSLPAGLTLGATTGIVSGTPTATGTFNITATVADASSPAQTRSIPLSLVVAPPALAITVSAFPSGTQGTSYSKSLMATGGTTPYTWSITLGSLPAGLNLTPSTGVISGIPTANGTFNFTATITDSSSPTETASTSISLVIAPPALVITTTSLPSGTQSTSYSKSLTATGGTAPYNWSITSGSLPAGLSLAANTGLISGTPTANGSFPITVTVKDASSPAQTTSATISFVIAPPPISITTTSLPSATQGTSYSKSLAATGGTAPFVWSITSGILPAGLNLNANTGSVSGTPTTSGSFSVSVMVKDSSAVQQSATANVSFTVAAATPPLTITTGTLPSGTDGTAYSAPLSATGGTPSYTWSITSGSLPTGLTLAATTGTISGTPTATGTSTFTTTVADNSNPSQSKSLSASITVSAAASTGPGTTWYIRADGGTRYSANQTAGQCDGKADVKYSGSGTNQHCAFKDPRYLWDDQSYGNDAWVIAGGDTVIIRGGPWRIGFDAAPGSCSGAGCGAGYTWCFGGGGNFGCYNPPIPAGTATQHTRILGENYAACSSGGVTTRSQLTQIFGGFGVTEALNLTGAKFVDVECLEVTRHSQCIAFGSPAIPATCSSGSPTDDYDSDGVHTDNTTHDLLMQDLWIHGHIGRGIKGPIGGLVTCLRCDIAFNGGAGWDFDDGNATPIVNGNWQFLYSTIEWSGCNQEYPAVHAIPVVSCYGQSTGGYGDGVGTPHGTGLSATIDHSKFIYNTQDGLDFGHVDTGGPYTLSITNSIAYSNSGGTFKIGGNFGTAVITNNVAIGDCMRLSAPITGAPGTYNANLTDFCRADDTFPFDFRQNSNYTISNNTIVTYSPTIFDISCWDSPGQGGNNNGCGGAVLNFHDNIVVGYDNPGTYNLGGLQGGPGAWYFQEPAPNGSTSGTVIGTINRSNNIYYGIGHGFTCPTGYANEKCVTPDFINQPAGTGTTFTQSELDAFNFNISSGSAAAGTGITYTGVPATDYNGVNRPNPPSMGAVEP
ncbi:beta strand repeat-containing protein [Tunturiibacter lichenicola]|uniref:beta strand repeat-containing protein n=1 Tax=Tunturiibacter lichenicola TaxID=2051959 RepID=UPI003D9AE053